MFFTPQILVHQKTKPQNFCEKADMKLRWKQVRILHGPATVRGERMFQRPTEMSCEDSRNVLGRGNLCDEPQVRRHA